MRKRTHTDTHTHTPVEYIIIQISYFIEWIQVQDFSLFQDQFYSEFHQRFLSL